MTKGAYMTVLNLDIRAHTSRINKVCMYWNGDGGGSHLEYFENNANYAPCGSIGPVYIVADGSFGECSGRTSRFRLFFDSGSREDGWTNIALGMMPPPVEIIDTVGPVWVHGANLNPAQKDASIGILHINPNLASGAHYAANGAGWMGALIDSNPDFLGRQLNTVSLPAAHDAGMSKADPTTTWATVANTKTQDLTVSQQLGAGVRFFDIRPCLWKISEGGGFHAGHFTERASGQGGLGESLNDILGAVRDFVDKNSREIVILKFSHYMDSDGTSLPGVIQKLIVDQVKTNLGPRMLTGLPTLKVGLLTIGQIIDGGKRIICVFDSLDAGLYDAANGVLRIWGMGGEHPQPTALSNNSNLDLYDEWSDCENTVQMMVSQRDKFHRFHNAGMHNGEMFSLSYTLSLTDEDNVVGPSIVGLAHAARPMLWHYANALYPVTSPGGFVRPPNFVYVDAVSANADENSALQAAVYFNNKVPAPLDMGHVPVGLRSAAFVNVGLRSDGNGKSAKCQWGIGSGERFYLIPTGTADQYRVQAVDWGAFLNLDPQGATQFSYPGVGKAYWTSDQAPSGVFSVKRAGSGLYTFESVQHPNVFLRLDGTGVTGFNAAGVGTANCQIGPAGPFEKIYIVAA